MARGADPIPWNDEEGEIDGDLLLVGVVQRLPGYSEPFLDATLYAGASPLWVDELRQLRLPHTRWAVGRLESHDLVELGRDWSDNRCCRLLFDLDQPRFVDALPRFKALYAPVLTVGLTSAAQLPPGVEVDVWVHRAEEETGRFLHAAMISASAPHSMTCYDDEDLRELMGEGKAPCRLLHGMWNASTSRLEFLEDDRQTMERSQALFFTHALVDMPPQTRGYVRAIKELIPAHADYLYHHPHALWRCASDSAASRVPVLVLCR